MEIMICGFIASMAKSRKWSINSDIKDEYNSPTFETYNIGMAYNQRDKISVSEVISDRKENKFIFLLKFARNWFLERMAAIAPVPTWRVALHRWRGIKIGKNVYIGYDVTFDRIYPELITIEDYAEIGDKCIISAHSRGSILFRDIYKRELKPVHIGRGSWIMPGVIITPGVQVGEMSVVATGSVVTKNVATKTMVAGVPAKLMKNLDIPVKENE
jgi:acetyltransferase-like isoleucine patch superfamily enzyme